MSGAVYFMRFEIGIHRLVFNESVTSRWFGNIDGISNDGHEIIVRLDGGANRMLKSGRQARYQARNAINHPFQSSNCDTNACESNDRNNSQEMFPLIAHVSKRYKRS